MKRYTYKRNDHSPFYFNAEVDQALKECDEARAEKIRIDYEAKLAGNLKLASVDNPYGLTSDGRIPFSDDTIKEDNLPETPWVQDF